MPSPLAADQPSRGGRSTPVPYTGWALSAAIDLDRACPGLLAKSMCFGASRRQALFLVLAMVEIHGAAEIARRVQFEKTGGAIDITCSDIDAACTLGSAVLDLRPRDLVRAVVGSHPPGLLGTLSRLGDDPAGEPALYAEIVRLFSSQEPADRRRAKVLAQIPGALDGVQVEIVCALDHRLLHPALVGLLREREHVEEIHAAVGYIKRYCSGATDAAIFASIVRLKLKAHRGDLVRAWSSKFDSSPVEFDTCDDPELVVLASAAALVDAGQRYANCLSDKVDEVFLGLRVYVEFVSATGAPGLLGELRTTSTGFLLEHIYAFKNRSASADRARAFRERLSALGVALLAHAPGDRDAFAATARLLGEFIAVDPDNTGIWGPEMVEVADDLERILAEAA